MLNYRCCLPCCLLLAMLLGENRSFAADSPADALLAVRKALTGRDIPGAEAALAEAEQIKGDAKYDDDLARLKSLTDYVGQFWKAYDRGLATLGAIEELEVSDTRVAVVEVGPDKLIIRANGTNRTYNRATVPPGLALVVAERVIKPNVPQNKVIIGAFAAMDIKGDKDKARKYWEEAQASGLDVKFLLAELDGPTVVPDVTVPMLTPQQKLLFDPRNWAQRSQGPRGYVRENLTIGEQNAEGQLEVKVPADVAEVQIVTKRGVPGDFAVRMILKDVEEGQQFGLFAPDNKADAVVVDLPKGTIVVEFGRQGVEYKARIAGKEVEVKVVGKPIARFAGLLGISAKAGQEFSLASFEFAAR